MYYVTVTDDALMSPYALDFSTEAEANAYIAKLPSTVFDVSIKFDYSEVPEVV